MELLQQWCSRGIFLQHGRVIASGDIKDVVAAYNESVGAAQAAG